MTITVPCDFCQGTGIEPTVPSLDGAPEPTLPCRSCQGRRVIDVDGTPDVLNYRSPEALTAPVQGQPKPSYTREDMTNVARVVLHSKAARDGHPFPEARPDTPLAGEVWEEISLYRAAIFDLWSRLRVEGMVS